MKFCYDYRKKGLNLEEWQEDELHRRVGVFDKAVDIFYNGGDEDFDVYWSFNSRDPVSFIPSNESNGQFSLKPKVDGEDVKVGDGGIFSHSREKEKPFTCRVSVEGLDYVVASEKI